MSLLTAKTIITFHTSDSTFSVNTVVIAYNNNDNNNKNNNNKIIIIINR